MFDDELWTRFLNVPFIQLCVFFSDRKSVQYVSKHCHYLAPEGVARSVCVSVCPANILVFYFSAIRRDIDLKFIRILIGLYSIHYNKLTFIGQRSRSQGRYLDF